MWCIYAWLRNPNKSGSMTTCTLVYTFILCTSMHMSDSIHIHEMSTQFHKHDLGVYTFSVLCKPGLDEASTDTNVPMYIPFQVNISTEILVCMS